MEKILPKFFRNSTELFYGMEGKQMHFYYFLNERDLVVEFDWRFGGSD